jgi:hypothetical protein
MVKKWDYEAGKNIKINKESNFLFIRPTRWAPQLMDCQLMWDVGLVRKCYIKMT